MFHIELSPLTPLIPFVSLILSAITTYNNITQSGTKFRLSFLFIAISAVLMSLAILATVTPLQIAIVLAIAVLLLVGVLLLALTSQRYRFYFARINNTKKLLELYMAQNKQSNHLLSELLNMLSNGSADFPTPQLSLNILLDILQDIFHSTSPSITFQISIVQTMPNNKFDVVTTRNLDLSIMQTMERNFSWDVDDPKGVAGKCAAEGKCVLCNDLSDETETTNSNWISLRGNRAEKGGILCVPVPYPENYDSAKRIGKCLGVLSISSSESKYFNETHIEWINDTYINAVENIMLIHNAHTIISKLP